MIMVMLTAVDRVGLCDVGFEIFIHPLGCLGLLDSVLVCHVGQHLQMALPGPLARGAPCRFRGLD